MKKHHYISDEERKLFFDATKGVKQQKPPNKNLEHKKKIKNFIPRVTHEDEEDPIPLYDDNILEPVNFLMTIFFSQKMECKSKH